MGFVVWGLGYLHFFVEFYVFECLLGRAALLSRPGVGFRVTGSPLRGEEDVEGLGMRV
jgi:hypothetical protein